MKTAVALQHFKKCIILFMVGTVCSALAFALYVVDPLKKILEHQLRLYPGTILYSLWEKPPIDVFIKVYIFNITNPVEFLRQEEKMKVQEIGPYVYQEYLENSNATFYDNGTMSYIPRRTVFFVPEMSVGDPEKDLVNVPNIPILGVFSALHDAGFFVNYPLVQLTNVMHSKPILNISVHDYLWGYEDTLVQMVASLVPNFFNFKKFGLLDRMYDEGENLVTLNVRKRENVSDEVERYLSIQTYNGNTGLAHWGYVQEEGNVTRPENTICNRIQGASEGTVFPSPLNKHDVFRVYRKAFCRALPIEFKKEVTIDSGISGYLYSLTDNFLDTPDDNPDNECYCRKMKKCLKKGISDLTPCYYRIPAAVSLPHFLNGDPSLVEGVEGLHPDIKKHGTEIVIQPTIGIPMKVNTRVQINLVMQRTRYNHQIAAFNDMVVPLFWADLQIPSLPNNLRFLLKLALQIMPVVQTVVICLLAITGATTILLSLIATLWVFNQQQEEHDTERRDSTDLRIPLGYGQYTAIRILPAIKKITSKTDLFS